MAYIKADSPDEQRYFDYLEELRQSGDTNMLGARPYLEAEFPELCASKPGGYSRETVASDVLMRWMKYHDDPKRILSTGERSEE